MAKLISLSGLSRFKADLPNFIGGLGFIKNTVNDLANYYLKSQTYTKTEVDSLVASIEQFTYELASVLPAASADTMFKIYLIPSGNPEAQNIKDEYITIDKGEGQDPRYVWEQIGSTAIDLSDYSTTAQMNAAIAAAVAGFKTEAQIRAIIEGYGYQANVLEGVMVDNVELTVSNKKVNLQTATDAEIDELFE